MINLWWLTNNIVYQLMAVMLVYVKVCKGERNMLSHFYIFMGVVVGESIGRVQNASWSLIHDDNLPSFFPRINQLYMMTINVSSDTERTWIQTFGHNITVWQHFSGLTITIVFASKWIPMIPLYPFPIRTIHIHISEQNCIIAQSCFLCRK